MPATTRLVVNADDLGLARSVNRGIVQTMAGGVVRSASLIVNTAAADDAVCCLREAREAGLDIGIGLHFNIVTGRPLTSCPSLAPGGAFHSLPVLALRALAGAVVAAEVEAELRAQLARARRRLATLGLTVTHVDSHRHAHALPGIYDVVVRTARDEDVPHVRHPVESPRVSLGRPAVWLAGALLRAAAMPSATGR